MLSTTNKYLRSSYSVVDGQSMIQASSTTPLMEQDYSDRSLVAISMGVCFVYKENAFMEMNSKNKSYFSRATLWNMPLFDLLSQAKNYRDKNFPLCIVSR